jgi:hypothetical protein
MWRCARATARGLPGSSPRSSDAGIIAHTHQIIASHAWTNLPPMQEVQRPLHSVLASASPRWAMALLATPTFLLCSAVQPPIHKVPNRRPNDRRPARLLTQVFPKWPG